MKKFIIFLSLFCFTMLLTGCGSTNVNYSNKINSQLNKLNGVINGINTIDDGDIIITDLLSDSTIASIKKAIPYENGIGSEEYEKVKNVAGYGFIVPNINRNTDTYGNYYNNRFGYYGQYPYTYGYGYNYPNMPYGYGYNNPYNYGIYNNGYGIIGTNIDTYKSNYNNEYNNGYNNGYYNNYYQNPYYPYNYQQRRFARNVNNYKNINSNINTYKRAKNSYNNRYDLAENYFQNDLNNQYQKLTDLCLVQYDLLNCNDNTMDLKTNILANISYLKSISEQIKKGSYVIDENQFNAVKELLINANEFGNKINVSKNEIKNKINNVKNLKINYSSNSDNLSAKYIQLLNSLDTRNLYLQNILSSLLQCKNIIWSNGNVCYNEDCEYNIENINNSRPKPRKKIELIKEENNNIDKTQYKEKYLDQNGELCDAPINNNSENSTFKNEQIAGEIIK